MSARSHNTMLNELKEWRGNAAEEGIRLSQVCCERSFDDLNALAGHLGISIDLVELPQIPHFGGCLVETGEPSVLVNSATRYLFRQFSIAHEIGHFVLNHTVDRTPLEEEQFEFQAQVFAFVLVHTVHRGRLFDHLDENIDLDLAICYAWMPDEILLGSPRLEIVYRYIQSRKLVAEEKGR